MNPPRRAVSRSPPALPPRFQDADHSGSIDTEEFGQLLKWRIHENFSSVLCGFAGDSRFLFSSQSTGGSQALAGVGVEVAGLRGRVEEAGEKRARLVEELEGLAGALGAKHQVKRAARGEKKSWW